MLISFIIINYNTDELTLKAVESIYRYVKNISFEVIVIDNNSTDTKLETILLNYKNTYFYKLSENIGFGRANNFGYSKSKGKFIFLLNSDAYLIEENTILAMKNYLEINNNVAIVGCNLVTEKLKPNICHGKFLSVERVLYNYGLKEFSKDYFNKNLATSNFCDFMEPTEVDHLTGAALMLKKDVIEKLGLFNPKYFMYLEDMDIAFRYKKAGYLSVLIPQVKIVHIGGQSTNNNTNMSKRIIKEIDYSRFLFLQNVTSYPIALSLFLLGKLIGTTRRIKKGIINRIK